MGVSDKFPNSIFSSKTKASRRKFLFFPFSTFYVSRLTTISEAACTCSRDLNASIGKSTETKRLARKHSKAQDEIYQYQARMSKIRSFPSRWTNFPRLRQKTRCDKSSCHEILDTDPRMVQLAACENNLWATRWICTRSSVHPWMHHLPLSLSLSLSFPYIRGECSQAKSKQRTQGETREACKLARRSHNTREPRKTTAPAETGARRITSSFVFPLLANGATLKGQTIPWKFTIARENVSCLARSHSFLSVVPTGSQAHLCTGLFCIW